MRATMTIAVAEGATMILLPGGVIMTGMEEEDIAEATMTGRGVMTAVEGATTKRETTTGATRRCPHLLPAGNVLWINRVSQWFMPLKSSRCSRVLHSLGKVCSPALVSDSLTIRLWLLSFYSLYA